MPISVSGNGVGSWREGEGSQAGGETGPVRCQRETAVGSGVIDKEDSDDKHHLKIEKKNRSASRVYVP